jgi:adhesin transport system membrane fusion protein
MSDGMEQQTQSARQDAFESFRAHATYWLCVVTTAAAIAWAAWGSLDIVSNATGEVIPSTQVKTVQHLEGGIVNRILVREGQAVAKGQRLIVLEPTATSADVGELQVRLTALRAQVTRLRAQLNGDAAPDFEQDLKDNHAELVTQATRSFEFTRRRHESEIAKQQKSILQRKHAINEINTRLRGHRHSLKLLREQVRISEQLLRENLSNRYKHLDLLKEEGRLTGEIAEAEASLISARAALEEAGAELITIKSIFADETQKELDEARLTYNELSQRVQKFKDSLRRTTLRSPVEGVVKTIYVATIGGVLKPGEPVVDIVPNGDRLIIEAQLPTQDIGFVQSGQLAVVKLASADAARFGGLDGKVVSVSPDTLMTPEGAPFYKVRIETGADHFRRGPERYNLFPGMQVIASIHTGERTVFQYLFQPFIDSMDDAMRER